MNPRREGALSLVDDACDVVMRLGAFCALLWLTAIPARLALVRFVTRLAELGDDAGTHGHELRRLAYGALALWLVSLFGRYVFVRAARHALQSGQPPPRSLLRVAPRELLAYVGAAIALEALFWLLFVTFIVPIAVVLVAGLAAAVAPKNPLRALGEIFAGAGSILVLLRLALLFLVALLVVLANVQAFSLAALWAASGLARVDAVAWQHVLSLTNPLYACLAVAAASLLLEPFWLAALTAHVERTRSRSTGEDLLRWFDDLRARA